MTADNDEIERGRHLFAQECTFLLGAVRTADLPAPGPVEIAFAGRSNVGKSSLINALTGRRSLARTSNTPGRTRQLNFFDLGGRLNLVDLPGYGYAKAAKSEIRAWNRLIVDYLRGRPTLRRVFLLIDSRHGLKDSDIEVMRILDESAVSYQAVLTKADKPSPGELEKQLAVISKTLAKHVAAHPDVLVTSATSGAGVADLRAAIAALAGLDEIG